jgi:hypothetical protein
MSKSDKRRYESLQRHGCIASRKAGWGWVAPDIHHIVSNGYRRLSGGNKATIPLSPWFHRGVPPCGLTEQQATDMFGPSMALNKKAFVERFGTEAQLLEEVNLVIESMEKA